MLDITEMELAELENELELSGVARYHARQIYRWIYRHGIEDFERMTNLSHDLRHQLTTTTKISTLKISRKAQSSDGTVKFLLKLKDGHQIESVFIPDTPAQTLCISTQVGCAMACTFCLTGNMGLIRNLSAGEISGQVRVLAKNLNLLHQRFNIVLMGMGEPLHNYDATMKALRLLTDKAGIAISPRRITLSTVGLVPALKRLATEPLIPNLAVSLHATSEVSRARLVPVNRKYSLAEVLDVCAKFPLKHRSRITFEYVLLKNVNDSLEEAKTLAKLLRGVRSKVNLIPLNESVDIPFERPDDGVVDRFAKELARHHLTVSVRKSRGHEIQAACGQLIVGNTRESTS